MLSLRKLETFPRALLPVLLALFDPRIASHQTRMFESWTKVGIELEQRSRDAVPDRARLSRRATAGHVDNEIKLACRFRQLQRLTNDHAQGFVREISVKRFAIDKEFAAA